MWLSQKAAGAEAEPRSPARLADITIGGERAAVISDGESRSLGVASVGGVCWKPCPGEQALVIDCADGAAVVAGVIQSDWPSGLQAGEVCIRSKGGAVIHLKNNGDIAVTGGVALSGALTVTGSVAVSGSMTLNGFPVAVIQPL